MADGTGTDPATERCPDCGHLWERMCGWAGIVRFQVNGLPAPQGSKRHVGGGRMVESSKAVGPWREAVRAEAQRQFWDGRAFMTPVPLSVAVVFVFARPQGHYGTGRNAGQVRASAPAYPAAKRKNDIEKLVRSTLDGLVDGGLMIDDGLVVSLSAAKVYARDGEVPGAVIEVEAMT